MDYLKNKRALKNIELYLKRKINMLIQNNFSSYSVQCPESIFHSGNIKKVLLLRQDRIGDVLISTPFLKNLREKLPEAEIHILLSSKNYSSKNAVEPYTDKIHIYNKKPKDILLLIHSLRKENFDLIIDLFDNISATSKFLLKYIKSRWKLGIDKGNATDYTHTVPLLDKMDFHIVDRVNNLLLPFNSGPKIMEYKLIYHLNEDEFQNGKKLTGNKTKEYRLGINLSGSTESKFWGVENNINFCRLVNSKYKYIEIVLFTTVSGQLIAEEIRESIDARIAPLTHNFHEFAAMVSTCDIILSPDTSVIHLSSAFQIPVIGLFEFSGENFGMPWYPYSCPNEVLTDRNSIKNISPEMVLEKFEKLFVETVLAEKS